MADNQFIFDFLVGKDDVTPTMDKTRKSTQNFGESVDRMGRQSMIAMRSFGEAGKLAGFSDELVKATYNAANMTDVIGDMAGASKEYADQLLRLERAAQGDVWGNRLAQIQGGGGDLGGGLIDSLKNLGKQYISVAGGTGEVCALGGGRA